MYKNYLVLLICFSFFCCTKQKVEWKLLSLEKYQTQLQAIRNEFRAIDQPDVKFFLFGMGNRTKMIYKKGRLYSAVDSSEIRSWLIENYAGMKIINEIYYREKCSAPHTWHAAEIFLYLSEIKI